VVIERCSEVADRIDGVGEPANRVAVGAVRQLQRAAGVTDLRRVSPVGIDRAVGKRNVVEIDVSPVRRAAVLCQREFILRINAAQIQGRCQRARACKYLESAAAAVGSGGLRPDRMFVGCKSDAGEIDLIAGAEPGDRLVEARCMVDL
jgi:hypothetical protein